MAIGQEIKGIPYQYKDEYTGVEVIRLSDNVGNTVHPYFTQPLFSADGPPFWTPTAKSLIIGTTIL